MAGNPVDPLSQLSRALAVPADSKEQADLLGALRESLEAQPSPIPILCTTLIKTVSGAGDSLLKRWVLDLLHFAICRSTLTLEVRTKCQFLTLRVSLLKVLSFIFIFYSLVSFDSVDTLAGLLHDANPYAVKVAIQTLTTVFPLLFRQL